MNQKDALLETILTNPSDDTPRLILADLLRESDDPSERARGQFLWAGLTAARFRTAELIDDPAYYTAQREIGQVAAAGEPARWLAEWGIGSAALRTGDWAWDCVHDRVTVRLGGASGIFTGGMLTGLSVELSEWYRLATDVLSQAPLQTITITDIRGLTLAIDQQQSAWRISAQLKAPPQRIPLMSGPIPFSMAPNLALIADAGDWRVEETFSTRSQLIASINSTTFSLITDLRDAAGDRWPGPTRGRKS